MEICDFRQISEVLALMFVLVSCVALVLRFCVSLVFLFLLFNCFSFVVVSVSLVVYFSAIVDKMFYVFFLVNAFNCVSSLGSFLCVLILVSV